MPKILVVEDEQLIALMVEEWLMEMGHDVIGPAPDVARALSLIESGQVEAAILDINLGGRNSFDVAEALNNGGIPFVFASGHGAPTIDGKWRDVPALSKPYSYESLMAAVSQLLSR